MGFPFGKLGKFGELGKSVFCATASIGSHAAIAAITNVEIEDVEVEKRLLGVFMAKPLLVTSYSGISQS
jgi:hypothetical protein